ncbi:hypothetical protein D9613_008766 [Agrocybe pediades]|uniref:CCL2-like lectin domain-containing protein n=1 Tax=Agrocybe pediades TaxID=84607 RepID=A0A8H4QU45_9AGAR|nr:hypothetical protein D9613_008766 [Agrocybe pediades]KAF9554208.1 hypothetical protein CPC08DRAFT_766896 [Agrocybe pediades]
MSRPNQGSYVIYNRVLSPTGDKLAITFTGQNNTLTVTPMTKSSNQVFNLTNNDTNTMFVVPQSSSGLQVGWGSNGATPMTPGGYVWTIKSSDAGYTIQDGGMSQNWHLDKAANNANVAIAADQGNERYRWVLEPVSQ